MTAPRRLLFVLPDLGDGGAPRVTVALLAAMDPARYQLSLLNLGARNSALAALLPPQVQLLHRSPTAHREAETAKAHRG